jgi:hypothetical protein
MALGHHATATETDSFFADMGLTDSNLLHFDLFLDWWTSGVGFKVSPRATNPKSRK